MHLYFYLAMPFIHLFIYEVYQMKKLYIKIKECRATFYISGALVLLISLFFTFFRYKITVERFISAITHLKNSFVHYFKVTWLKKANYGTYYGPSESVSYLKVLDFLPFDVDKVIFKFQNLLCYKFYS